MDQSNNQSSSPMKQGNQRLNEHVILVTGALEGIGRAVALACAAEGATLILSSFEEVDLEPVYDSIVANGDPQPAILPLNLETAKESDFIGAADIIADTFGRLDGLVHCAASAPFLSRIDDYDASEWEGVIRINLTAPFMLTQACMPILRMSEHASIVFTSDRVGRQGMAYWGAYAAAKFGTEGLMQVLAEETGDSSQIRVNSIDPGILRTALRANLYPGEDPKMHPAPESVTEAYIQLLSTETQGMTGQSCRVEASSGKLV